MSDKDDLVHDLLDASTKLNALFRMFDKIPEIKKILDQSGPDVLQRAALEITRLRAANLEQRR